jgi:hypothetical protein
VYLNKRRTINETGARTAVLGLGSPNYGPRANTGPGASGPDMPGIRPAIVYFDYIVKFTM